MPAIPLKWMDSKWQQASWHWASAYSLLAPQLQVKGRMALVLLAAVLWAFLWLLWRAYTVVQTPNEVLVDKLGLDIPPEPLVILEEISARQIQISWKSTDTTSSIQEHHVEVNGRIAGVTKKHEFAAVISNLIPGTFYDIRIFSVSPGHFQTPSSLLHVRTSSSSSDSSQDGNSDGLPLVRALAPRIVSTVPAINSITAATRESITGQNQGRRGTAVRRHSPAGQHDINSGGKYVDDESSENLAELSQQFQRVSQETETIESQIQEEIREHEMAARDREARMDAVKQEMKERDEASSDLKRQVHRAEATNRSLQSEKSKKEKQLKDRENSRRKRKDEMVKWEEHAQSMAEEIEGINKQKEAIRRRTESDAREIRLKNAEEQREIQQLEDENRDKAFQLKELQEERKRNAIDEETDESREADRLDQERDVRFRQRLSELQQNYNIIWQEMQQAHQENIIARQRLTALEMARRSTAVSFAPVASVDIDNIRRGEKSLRRTRHASSQGSNVSSPRAAFAAEPYHTTHQAVTASPTTQRNTFFNRVNGMSLPFDVPVPMDEDDEDHFSAAPMSPRADALLPHDLLGDESADDLVGDDEDFSSKFIAGESQSIPFPSIGPPSIRGDANSPESASPQSESSARSFTSPREEFFSGDHESDQYSTRSSQQQSVEVAAPDSGHKRLTSMSNLFSFNRQRGKTLADQPPLLGSLKPGQSQSFPRKMDEFDSAQPKRRLSYGGVWAFPGSGLLGKTSTDREEDGSKAPSSRRAFPSLLGGIGKASAASRNYDPFAPRTNSFDPSATRAGKSSSRPSSVYSFDKMPRPSVEDSFRAWVYERPGARNSPLAPDWVSTASRNHSRRPSIYGSSTNLSLNPPVEEDGEFIEPRRDTRPLQAPIGTRPASSQRPVTPKLNPNAPAFTMFGFGKSKDKSKEKSKGRDTNPSESMDNGSPPEPRKSRDEHSIAATASTLESRDSLERIVSGLSGAQSLESTPASKPTFISKITRKASANKFGSWKDKSSNLFSRKEATTPTGDTEDEHGSTEHLGRSLESSSSTPGPEDKKGSRPSLSNWSFMRKKSTKAKEKEADLAASEISESSEVISEGGEDQDDDSIR